MILGVDAIKRVSEGNHRRGLQGTELTRLSGKHPVSSGNGELTKAFVFAFPLLNRMHKSRCIMKSKHVCQKPSRHRHFCGTICGVPRRFRSSTFKTRGHRNGPESLVFADIPPSRDRQRTYCAAVFPGGYIDRQTNAGNWSDETLDRFGSFESIGKPLGATKRG